MRNKIKLAILAGLALKGAAVLTTSLVNSYKKQQKFNEKFYTPLDKDLKIEYLKTKAHEINKIFSQVRPLFESKTNISDLGEAEEEKLFQSNTFKLDVENTAFFEVEFEFDELSELDIKCGYYKIIARSDKRGITEFLLRLTVDDWDGYMDVKICEMEGFDYDDEKVFVVKKKGDVFTMSPEVDTVLYYNISALNDEVLLLENTETQGLTQVKNLF